MTHISDRARRHRLVARHHLGRTAVDVLQAARDLVAVHSSDPATPHLAMWARVGGFATDHLEEALVGSRSLWRLHAMRRTLFVVPAADAEVFRAGAARDVLAKERKRLTGWLAAELGDDGLADWLRDVSVRTVAALEEAGELRTQDLTARVPELATEITLGSGKWATRAAIGSRLLFLLALDGAVVRTRSTGTWRSGQYHWAATSRWFAPVEEVDAATGRAELARRYLARHGPVTAIDLRWWTGWTARQAAAALQAVGAAEVRLDDGVGYVLPDDRDPGDEAPPSVALLPALDSTPMGWKQRGFLLGPHEAALFDRNGNIGPTVWVDGRIVGGWGQRPDGEVAARLLEDVGADRAAAVEAEAARLTDWMGGVRVTPRFRTPLERELSS